LAIQSIWRWVCSFSVERNGKRVSSSEHVAQQTDGIGDIDLAVVVHVSGIQARDLFPGEEVPENRDGVSDVSFA